MNRTTALFLAASLLVSSAWGTTTRFRGFTFESYAISDLGYRYPEIMKTNGAWMQVERDDGYSLVIRNPLPVRVAVAVTIDGLNVIDGKRTSPDKAQKWMIEAHSSLTLRGWQTDRSSLRRFVFTDKHDSYAEWKGDRDNKPYTRNLGVIGVAYFWNSAELYAVQHPPRPRPFESRRGLCAPKKSAPAPAAAKERSADACESAAVPEAGTGMGEREVNNVIDVVFRYDTGMYREKDVLVMYYEFTRHLIRPRPFADENDRRDFVPEMP